MTGKPAETNKLCSSCRRTCKQAVTAILVNCTRYYPFPFKVKKETLKQGSLWGE